MHASICRYFVVRIVSDSTFLNRKRFNTAQQKSTTSSCLWKLVRTQASLTASGAPERVSFNCSCQLGRVARKSVKLQSIAAPGLVDLSSDEMTKVVPQQWCYFYFVFLMVHMHFNARCPQLRHVLHEWLFNTMTISRTIVDCISSFCVSLLHPPEHIDRCTLMSSRIVRLYQKTASVA